MIRLEYRLAENLHQINNGVYFLESPPTGLCIGGFLIEAIGDTPHEANPFFLQSICSGAFWQMLRNMSCNSSRININFFLDNGPNDNNHIVNYKKFWKCDETQPLMKYKSDNMPEVSLLLGNRIVYATCIPITGYESFIDMLDHQGRYETRMVLTKDKFCNETQIQRMISASYPPNRKNNYAYSQESFIYHICSDRFSAVVKTCEEWDESFAYCALLTRIDSPLWQMVKEFYCSITACCLDEHRSR